MEYRLVKQIKIFAKYLLILHCAFLIACGEKGNEEKTDTVKTIEAKPQTLVTPLFFNGTVSPLDISNVNSPLEGVVIEKDFQYGQLVNKGDTLVIITSEQLEKDFLSTVSDYMKSVDGYTSANRKFIGSQELWKLQFISTNEYYQDKSARDEAYFSMRQSAYQVKRMLEKLGIDVEKVRNFDLTDKDVIDKILAKKQDTLAVKASASGIALTPIANSPSSGSDSSSTENIQKGSEVKQGQVILSIGNMTGLTVQIDVNEVDISQIKVNQKAEVTSSAFPGFVLEGYVSAIDIQAKSGNAAIPTFSVTITVPKLTPEQQKVIFVGMSAKVSISIGEENVIVIPIEALFQMNGRSMVKVKDKKTGDIKSVPVVTGKTTMNSIAILKGIKPGDIIVYGN